MNRADVGFLLLMGFFTAIGGAASYRTLKPVALHLRAAWFARGGCDAAPIERVPADDPDPVLLRLAAEFPPRTRREFARLNRRRAN